MTLSQLRYAITVADSRSMNQAAQKLFISQPSLSAAIRELEDEVGIEIFRRTNRGIQVTPDGEEFVGYARQVVEQYALIEARYVDKEKVKKTLNYKDCFVTRKLEEQTGEFYKQTLYGPNDKNVKPVIPLKKGMNIEKYGGYSGENKAYFTIFSYIDKKNKKQVEMIGIPVKTSYDIKNNKITLKEYVESQIDNTTEVKIIKPKILKYQEYLDENNEPMVLLSDRELRTNKQLVLPSKVNKLIYLMNKEKVTEDEKIEVEMNIEEVYNYLIKKLNDEYKSFSSIYEKAKDDKTKNKFNEMSYDDKVVTINGLLDLMHKGQGNLSKIGLGDRAGRTRKSAFKTKDLENMTFIDKSVTGIYERRYKVNGMENGSSK